MYDVILLNSSLETEYRCKTIDFLWHSKFLEVGEFQIQILIEDDLDLTVCKYVTVNTKKEIGIIQKWDHSSGNPGTVIVSGYFMEHLLYESVLYPTYTASNKTIWAIAAEVCNTYLDDIGFPLVLPSQPSSGVIVSDALSVTMQQTGDYVGTLLYDQAAVFGYGVSLSNKLKATNLITNSDFSTDDLTLWRTSACTNTIINEILCSTANGVYYAPYSRVDTGALMPTLNSKIYFRAKVRVTNAVCMQINFAVSQSNTLQLTNGRLTVASPAENQWYELFGVATVQAGLTGNLNAYIQQIYADSATANNKVLEADNLLVIDLTATFGAGNEPTAAEMDTMLAQYDGWFDGTEEVIPITPTLRIDIENYHDRTGETEDEEVVFSTGLNSIKKYDVVKDKSNYRNVAVVAGQGEGSARIFEVVDISETGDRKRYLWVDAKDLQQAEDQTITDYRAELTQRGLEKLAETVEIDNIEIEIEDEEAQKIGTEYNIGDIVWVIINPLQIAYKIKIIEVEDVYSQGKRSTSLIFGDKIPTPWEKVRKLFR